MFLNKAFSTHRALGALLTDLSKAFDCIDHRLLIAKLYSYGISLSSINLLSSYLSNRTQRIKINDCFSLRNEIESGVPQGSILGPLLFNIDLTDLRSRIAPNTDTFDEAQIIVI